MTKHRLACVYCGRKYKIKGLSTHQSFCKSRPVDPVANRVADAVAVANEIARPSLEDNLREISFREREARIELVKVFVHMAQTFTTIFGEWRP